MDPDCMGCRTAAGCSAEDEVYRDDRVVAVVSQHAVNSGHLVLVTREHVRNALTMEPDLLIHMTLVGRELARRLREALGCPGIMIAFNNEAPCQTLFHAHMHLVPRYHGDEMDTKFGDEVPPDERAAVAARLREWLAAGGE